MRTVFTGEPEPGYVSIPVDFLGFNDTVKNQNKLIIEYEKHVAKSHYKSSSKVGLQLKVVN